MKLLYLLERVSFMLGKIGTVEFLIILVILISLISFGLKKIRIHKNNNTSK